MRLSQTTLRLRLFPLSLIGEATNWLNEMPDDSIRTWIELKEAFLERFFPESKEMEMKDEISAHKQLPGEAMHGTWWRFSRKLKNVWRIIYEEAILREHATDRRGRNYSRKGQYDRPANREQGNWQNRVGYRNDHSGVYVPPSNRDQASGSSSESKLVDMLDKVLQKVESTDAGVKEMKGDFSSMSQLVDSYTTSIKKIEQQLGQLSASLNQRKSGSLPSDTIQNPKKDKHCMAIASRSGNILADPISTGTNHEQVLEQAGREEDEAEQVDDLEDTQLIAKPAGEKEKEVKGSLPLQQIPRPPPYFPQRQKKKAEDGKFTKFITMLRQLSVNIPLVEALELMPGYTKFMKDLVTKKRVVSIDMTNHVHHCNAIATRSLVQKKEDSGVFTIPCTIDSIKFAKSLV
ncbi:uncharacterized protein [Solanum tuberosum]|uniref:uncharacterized protein n=1 Tax=Solanum tuberosum TaxID=4113 RepID=UPI00073A0D8A|nr:PREDICTED: uncharacterized protein LOC107061156 [Solanum tuberosum]